MKGFDLFMKRDATFFGADHRVSLSRVWDERLPMAAWLMCNPSRGDATRDDPTLTRVIHFSRAMGCGSAVVVNFWPLITPYPADLWPALDTIDPAALQNNYDEIGKAVSRAAVRVVAFGAEPMARAPDYAAQVLRLFTAAAGALCLGVSKDGWPLHPLARGKSAIVNSTEPQLWMWPGRPPMPGGLALFQSCGSCNCYSGWMSGAGDCMAYAYDRQDARLRADVPNESQWPMLPAPVVLQSGWCPGWQPAENEF